MSKRAHEILKRKIENKEAKLAVIGLGYVGLPVACCFAAAGFDVIGVDIVPEKIEKINNGISTIEGYEPGLDNLVTSVVRSKKLIATTDYQDLKNVDIVIVSVETPVDDDHKPDYSALRSAISQLVGNLTVPTLISIESTTSPGTIRDLVMPIVETNGLRLDEDIFLGNCPERVMPGKLLLNIKKMNRVVGAMSEATAELMVSLYKNIVEGDLDTTDCTTAEMVKTAENAYRDVQIAFANEVALICEEVGSDVSEVRELVNKSPGRNMLFPGAGVGGHCIPKDPWLLINSAGENAAKLNIIPGARKTNDSMPKHMVDLLSNGLKQVGKNLNDAQVLILGFSYLEDSDDVRNSPSQLLVDQLVRYGAKVLIHDPYVSQYNGNLVDMARGCDAAVLMVKHQDYYTLDVEALKSVMSSPVLIDGRGVFSSEDLRNFGFEYSRVGLGR